MAEVLLGGLILILPYIIGLMINVIEYGNDFKYYEGIGWTYIAGIMILAVLCTFISLSWFIGSNVMVWFSR